MNQTLSGIARMGLILVAGCSLFSAALAEENKLEAYRQQIKDPVSRQTESIVGQVDHVGPDTITTTISVDQLQQHGIGQSELLTVVIGGKKFPARTIDRDNYVRLQDQKHVRQTMDVDVVCVLDNVVSVVGLSGGLVDWLKPYPGSVVTLTKMH